MLPLDETFVVGQTNELLLRQIIATVLALATRSWSDVLVKGEITASSTENDIAGCLGRRMIAIKNQEYRRYLRIFSYYAKKNMYQKRLDTRNNFWKSSVSL